MSSYDKAAPSNPLGGAPTKTEKTKLVKIQNTNVKTPIAMLYECFTKEYVTFREVRLVFKQIKHSDWLANETA